MAKTGIQDLLFQSHKTFFLSQYSSNQYALEAMVKKKSHEQLQVQMTFPKEANGSSQYSGYSYTPEPMVKFGQMSPHSQALAISLFTQDVKNQDAPEAVPKSEGRTSMAEPLWTILQNECKTMNDRNTIIHQEGWTKTQTVTCQLHN
jgi:hypothetical protein